MLCIVRWPLVKALYDASNMFDSIRLIQSNVWIIPTSSGVIQRIQEV